MFTIELNNITSCTIKGKHKGSSIGWLGSVSPELVLTSKFKSMKVDVNDGSVTKHHPLIDRLVGESRLVLLSKNGKLFTIIRPFYINNRDIVSKNLFGIYSYL